METENQESRRPINVYASTSGDDPETIQAVQDAIKDVLEKFKDSKGLVYINIENLHVHPGGKHRGPPPPPHFWRGRSRSGSRRRSRSRSRSRSHSGHRRSKHGHGRRHSRNRHSHSHSHGHKYHGHGKHFFWHHHHSSEKSESVTGETSAEETSGLEAGPPVPPCCYMWDKKFKKKDKKRRTRSRSGSKDKKGRQDRKEKRCQKNKCKDQDQSVTVTTDDIIDLSSENPQEKTEKELQEKFDDMNVKSP